MGRIRIGIFGFIFALVAGIFALAFSLLSLWAKSYNLWWLALIFSLGTIYLAVLSKNSKNKMLGAFMIGVAVLGWIIVSKIFFVPSFILAFAGIIILLEDSSGQIN